MIRVLGFCASPRVGNSLFLLNQALESVKARAAELGEEVEIDTCTIRAKKLAGCVMCQGCMHAVNEHLSIFNPDKGFLNTALSHTQGFYFRSM